MEVKFKKINDSKNTVCQAQTHIHSSNDDENIMN